MHIVGAISVDLVQIVAQVLHHFTKSCHCRCQDVAHHGPKADEEAILEHKDNEEAIGEATAAKIPPASMH